MPVNAFVHQSFASHTLARKGLLNQENPGIGISMTKNTSILTSCMGISNTHIKLTHNQNRVDINYNKLTSSLNKTISKFNETAAARQQWIKQENTTLVSAEVNRIIDLACIKTQAKLDHAEKAAIFDKIASTFDVDTDMNCAQSSIKQVLSTNAYLQKKLDQLHEKGVSPETKCTVNNFAVNRIVDKIYQREYGGVQLSAIRDKTAQEALRMLAQK
nr:hypothetical protein [uncultured Enterobacter sp.]